MITALVVCTKTYHQAHDGAVMSEKQARKAVQKRKAIQDGWQRGRVFEKEERAGWGHIPVQHIQFEAATTWQGKRGRIDIRIDDGSHIAVIEVKSTNWDKLKPGTIRSTALRHARQIWRYIDDYVETRGKTVSPGIVYENEPEEETIRLEVERAINERCVQVVWRKEKQCP